MNTPKTSHIQTYTFDKFKEALRFLEDERKSGHQGIYFPRGGDTPRKITVEPVTHVVVILKESVNEQ
jgi:hypothetical protein